MDPWAAFCDPSREGTWKEPFSRVAAEELLVSYYLSKCCSEVVSRLDELGWTRGELAVRVGDDPANVRRKINGEYPATHSDLLRWTIALGHPEIMFAPGDPSQLLPSTATAALRLLGLG